MSSNINGYIFRSLKVDFNVCMRGTQFKTIMVASVRVTRSSRSLNSKAVSSLASVENSAKVVVLKVKPDVEPKKEAKPKLKPKPKPNPTTTGKFDVEEHVKHITIPADLALPVQFTDYHTGEFVTGVNHILKVDPSLYPVIVFKNFPHFATESATNVPVDDAELLQKYWYSLVSSVISQQVSGAAAVSIEKKFNLLFDPLPKATPSQVLTKTHEELRGAGLSNKKVEYVQYLSEQFLSNESNLAKMDFYRTSTDEQIMEELVALKGIGPWSAKMFLTFTLKRYNIFAHDDLGVARGAYRYLARRKHILDNIIARVKNDENLTKLLSRRSKFAASKGKRDWTPYHDVYIGELGKEYAPYQLIMMLVLWRLSCINMDVLEGHESKNEEKPEETKS